MYTKINVWKIRFIIHQINSTVWSHAIVNQKVGNLWKIHMSFILISKIVIVTSTL